MEETNGLVITTIPPEANHCVQFIYCNSVETGRLHYFHQCQDKAEFLAEIDRFIRTYGQCDIPCSLGLTHSYHVDGTGIENRISFSRGQTAPKNCMAEFRAAKAFIEAAENYESPV